jgi:hypothetical protein
MSDPLAGLDAAIASTKATLNGHAPKQTHSAQSDIAALAEKADHVVANEDIPSQERLIHLRHFADTLITRVNDGELRQFLWNARRKLNGDIKPHGPGARLSLKPAPWIWQGIVMEGTTNLVVALPKVGKSRLLTQMLGHLARNEHAFLGQSLGITDANFLIVGTDQPESDWATCLHLAGLLPDGAMHPRIVALYDKGRPLHLDEKGVEEIAEHCQRHPGLIILLDSYFACVQSLGLQERDANYAGPLLDLQEAIAPFSATLVVIHHSNKSATGDGASAASRGTTAMPGAVSQTISLARLPKPSPLAPTDRRIKLTTEGRGGHPLELLIEQTDDGHAWISHGDADTVARRAAAEEVINSLNDRQTLAIEDICTHWHATEQPMDAGQLAAALAIEGANPLARARDVLSTLERHHLIEKAGERPAEGGRGGKPSTLYRPTNAALDLYRPAPSIASIASLPHPIDAKDGKDGVCADTRARASIGPLPVAMDLLIDF